MLNLDNPNLRSDSARSALDRHAVNVAGYLLMAGMWLEHRAREIWENPRDPSNPRRYPDGPT
jgi:hypothetical protein